ncbi:Abi-alpha family protein [Chryseobacterium vaccae]|uniref:Abi-alpha family protein n=1 Tax=Chryseobacterium vaccae TaxID=2604424 RepID=UPI0012967D86|nr:Abi-alpha family protein [Chryseobacterium vaccae]
MDEKNTLGFIKDTQQLLTTIYGDLAQPAVKKVGIALESVLEFSTSIFLPLKFQNEKWKLNFEKRLLDYKEKLNQIPEEDIIEVNPQIGVPIIEKLSYTTNDNIAEMFLNLLIKGSSIKTANIAHPSFISIIERISSDEAKIINYLKHKDYIPYISYKLYQNGSSSYNM